MFEIIVLASSFKSGNFFMDIALPAIAGGAVLLLILNSLLHKWGYALW